MLLIVDLTLIVVLKNLSEFAAYLWSSSRQNNLILSYKVIFN